MEIMDKHLESMRIHSSDINFENTEFSIMSIPPSDIKSINFNDPNYISHILSYLLIHPVKSDNFLESIAKYSNIKQYPNCHNIETEIIGFNNKYVFEMSFLIFNNLKEESNKIPKNDIGSLLNINDTYIFGTCLIYKSYISDIDYSMKIVDISKDDIAELLISRREPKMIIYDDDIWIEENVQDIEKYKKHLFKDNYINELDLNYMSYNLKILYTKSEYGENILPNIVDAKIESMIIYSIYGNMIDSFSLEEFKKIKFLINKKITTIDEDILSKKKDHMNRSVINTKYRFLNLMYRKNL